MNVYSPLSAAGEERVDGRSKVGVSKRSAKESKHTLGVAFGPGFPLILHRP